MKTKRIFAFILIIALLSSVPALAASDRAKQVAMNAVRQLGKPYKLLSDPPDSFNCSTLVTYCCNKVKSNVISIKGVNGSYKKIRSMSKLQIGDIVGYRIASGRTPQIMNYHFGIYCGKGYFIHASQNSRKVICSKVRSYRGKYLGAIRLF